MVQENLGQNTPNNGVPPSTSQQQTLGHNTHERVPPIDRTENDRASKETRRATILHLGFCPMQVKSQWYLARLLKVGFRPHALIPEKRMTRHSLLQPQILFFQGNENEIQKVVYPGSAKEDDNNSSASGSTHDEDQYMMMLWKLDLKYCLLWPQQQKYFGRSH